MASVPTAAKRRQRRIPLIWLVPVAAAILAGWFFYQRHQERGVEIVIQFTDGSGLKPSETTVAVSGVTVGRVRSVELADLVLATLKDAGIEPRSFL